jgi:hypothetical protein
MNSKSALARMLRAQLFLGMARSVIGSGDTTHTPEGQKILKNDFAQCDCNDIVRPLVNLHACVHQLRWPIRINLIDHRSVQTCCMLSSCEIFPPPWIRCE